ncbi:hypothetical protein ACN08Y_02850 [Rothia sp. P5764]|uniref:hypothetical protein n=1 Tax=Rothia sp. P5764 TaxID=3402654 RepID=UPI003AD1E31C
MITRSAKGLPPLIHVQGVATIASFFLTFLILPVLALNATSLLWTLANLPRTYRVLPAKILLLQIFFCAVSLFLLILHTVVRSESVL